MSAGCRDRAGENKTYQAICAERLAGRPSRAVGSQFLVQPDQFAPEVLALSHLGATPSRGQLRGTSSSPSPELLLDEEGPVQDVERVEDLSLANAEVARR